MSSSRKYTHDLSSSESAVLPYDCNMAINVGADDGVIPLLTNAEYALSNADARSGKASMDLSGMITSYLTRNADCNALRRSSVFLGGFGISVNVMVGLV